MKIIIKSKSVPESSRVQSKEGPKKKRGGKKHQAKKNRIDSMDSLSRMDRGKLWLELWKDLFSSPIHLDSAISKRPPAVKGWLAESFSVTLRRPTQVFKEAGIRSQKAEWWNWSTDQLAEWEGARKLSEFWASVPNVEEVRARFKSGQTVESDFPPLVIDEWKKTFGQAVASELINQLGQPSRVAIRLTNGLSKDEFLKKAKEDAVHLGSARPSRWTKQGILFDHYVPVLSAPLTKDWFDQGRFEIQDEGSQVMAAFAMNPEKVMPILSDAPTRSKPKSASELETDLYQSKALTVIDACAGAGGKTLALADHLRGKGRLYAYDPSLKKIQALRRRISRTQLNNVQAMTISSDQESDFLKKYSATADVVLVDAPCSGWGVFRRNPDIKWRLDSNHLLEMPKIQLRLLSLYQNWVKPGGRLVFGVCTFRKHETTEIVEAFSKQHPGFRKIGGGYLGPESCDGFYMFAWEKTK